MKIYKIDFNYYEPKTKMFDGVINTYYSDPDEGYWTIYSDSEMSENEILQNLTDENIAKYFQDLDFHEKA